MEYYQDYFPYIWNIVDRKTDIITPPFYTNGSAFHDNIRGP